MRRASRSMCGALLAVACSGGGADKEAPGGTDGSDGTAPGDGDDVEICGGDIARDGDGTWYGSIQAAVDATPEGGTVTVCDGTHTASVVLPTA